MDQDAINLAKSIRQHESGNDFNRKGASGEFGAYQWMPDTWKSHAQTILGDANAQMTPDNQQAVAYGMIKTWKDQGLNPAQIAAKWNSGSETGWENKIGVNKQGVQYNVPAYVKAVTDGYQQLKSQVPEQQQISQEQNVPFHVGDTKIDKNSIGAKVVNFLTQGTQKFGKTIGEALNLGNATDEYTKALNEFTKGTNQLQTLIRNKQKSGQDTSTLEQALNQHLQMQPRIEDFAGDIANKTNKQIVGEAMQTGLEAVSGGGLEYGVGAIKGASTFGGKVAQGAGVGATYGALGSLSSSLQEDNPLKKTLVDVGVGAIAGGTIGGLTSGLVSMLDALPNRIVKNTLKTDEVTSQYALENTKIGSIKSMYDETSNSVSNLGTQIDTILKHPEYANIKIGGAGITQKGDTFIANNPIVKNTIDAFPDSNFTDKDIIRTIKSLVPDKAKLVDKVVSGEATVFEANELKKSIYPVVKKVFTDLSNPNIVARKKIGAAFSVSLADSIKNAVPETVPIFEKLAKEINLRNILGTASKKYDSQKLIGLYDLATITAGSGFAGAPGAIAAETARKVSTMPGVKISTAKGIQSTTKSLKSNISKAVKNKIITQTGLTIGKENTRK